jgi:hypothetical protein
MSIYFYYIIKKSLEKMLLNQIEFMIRVIGGPGLIQSVIVSIFKKDLS